MIHPDCPDYYGISQYRLKLRPFILDSAYPNSTSVEVVASLFLTKPPLGSIRRHIDSANALTRKRYQLMYQLRCSAFVSRNM